MDEERRKRRGPLLWLAWRSWRFWAVTLPVLYALSIGPVLRLWNNGAIDGYMAGLLYVPVAIAATIIPGGKDALRWYLELWGVGF